MLHRLTEGAEDDPFLGKHLLEGGLHRDTIHHSIHGHAGQLLLLLERNTQSFEGPEQLRVHLIEALGCLALGGIGIIDDILKIDAGDLQVSPFRLLHGEPMAVGLQAELQEPFRLLLLRRDQPDHLFIETLLNHFGLHIGGEPEFILLCG
jgi:hypothetical protein